MRILLLVTLITLSMPLPAEAGFMEQASSMWNQVKAKVNVWWIALREPSGATENEVPPPRAPASEAPVESKGLTAEQAQQMRSQMQTQGGTRVIDAGQPAAVDIPKNKAGVAVYKLPPKVKRIPLLNVGQEAKIQSSDWQLTDYKVPKATFDKPKRLQSPSLIKTMEVTQFIGAVPAPAPGLKNIVLAALKEDQKVTPEMVAKLISILHENIPVKEMTYTPFSPEDMKFLRAIILYAQKDKCHFAAGLFADLSKAVRDEIAIPSEFFLGICMHQMGLFSESIGRLLKVIDSGNIEYLPTAIATLVRDVPYDHEIRVAQSLLRITDMKLVPNDVRDSFHYILAKGLSRSSKFELALQYAEKIDVKSKHYANAQFIAAVSEYALDRPDKGFERNKKLLAWIESNGNEKYIRTLVAHNLARFAFQKKDYKESIRYYSMVAKDHPLWMDALIEQGWAQLALGDSAGAVGNMYSMHSPFFKYVYKPESFVVRTIGYLNICQFGDAYKTLSRLEAEHRDLLEKIRKVGKTIVDPVNYYTAMVRFIDAKMSKDIDGIPGQVLREMGRQRDYLNVVNAINSRLDEMNQYKFLHELRQKDEQKVRWLKKKAEERLALLKANIKKAQVTPSMAMNLNQWKQNAQNEQDFIAFYKFNLEVFAESSSSSRVLEAVAKADLAKKRKDMIGKAGEFMRAHLKVLERSLEKMLENNEFLRYEVFAGSGENLRFEMAGGTAEAMKRVPANIKPKSADLSWSFDGEYWEDEIGHYRSSLKNNCGS